MRTKLKFLLGLTAALAAFLVIAPAVPALAHDQLVDQYPSEGEVLEQSPEFLKLSFNNKILDLGEGATVMNLTDASGSLATNNEPVVDGMDVVLNVDALADGAYRLIWRVVSSDGHPITGVLEFAVGLNGEEDLANLPPLGEDEASNSESAEEGITPGNADSQVNIPLIVAVTIAALGAFAGVIILTRRKSGPPPSNS